MYFCTQCPQKNYTHFNSLNSIFFLFFQIIWIELNFFIVIVQEYNKVPSFCTWKRAVNSLALMMAAGLNFEDGNSFSNATGSWKDNLFFYMDPIKRSNMRPVLTYILGCFFSVGM